jgi:hypothetical protein
VAVCHQSAAGGAGREERKRGEKERGGRKEGGGREGEAGPMYKEMSSIFFVKGADFAK